MCCVDDKFNGDADCRCYRAVMRAYGSLIGAGQSQTLALDVARTVYRFHHPEDLPERASLIVERWVHAGSLH